MKTNAFSVSYLAVSLSLGDNQCLSAASTLFVRLSRLSPSSKPPVRNVARKHNLNILSSVRVLLQSRNEWLEVIDFASFFLLKKVTYHAKNVDATVFLASTVFENIAKNAIFRMNEIYFT